MGTAVFSNMRVSWVGHNPTTTVEKKYKKCTIILKQFKAKESYTGLILFNFIIA